MKKSFLVVLALAGMISAAQAQTDDRYPSWSNRMQGHQAQREWRWPHKRSLVRKSHHPRYMGSVVGGRPSGCPYRFCGCALSLRIFGRIIPTLNLAANWMTTFPRVAPAPGMVAARRGHVFQLLAHSGGSQWRVWDANSGRGRIRIHDRSIVGYAVVDPHGASFRRQISVQRRSARVLVTLVAPLTTLTRVRGQNG